MKKIICLLLAVTTLLSTVSLAACANGGEDTETTDPSATNAPAADTEKPITLSLAEIAETIRSTDFEYPSLVTVNESEEGFMFEYEFGIAKPEGVNEVLVVKPIIGTVPFAIGLLRVDEGVDSAALAKQIKSSVDPNRLVCATSTYVETVARVDVIILVMDNDDARGQALIDAFKAL